jgi:hypothetical protein
MLALTVLQPWEWALSKGVKPVENRNWAPPKSLLGQYIALHAGKRIDEDGVPGFTEIAGTPHVSARIQAVHGDRPLTLRMLPLGAITCVARLARVVTSGDDLSEKARPWFFGPFGWVFEDVQEFEAIPCRGFQKLWVIPPDVASRVRAAWKLAPGGL